MKKGFGDLKFLKFSYFIKKIQEIQKNLFLGCLEGSRRYGHNQPPSCPPCFFFDQFVVTFILLLFHTSESRSTEKGAK